MDIHERFNLWQIEEVERLSDELSVVRNILSGQIMLKRISLPDSYEVMKTLSAVSHPNLMKIYDTDIIGNVCISLCEYIEGKSLEEIVDTFGVYSEKKPRRGGLTSALPYLPGGVGHRSDPADPRALRPHRRGQ